MAPELSACVRILGFPCAVMKMIGTRLPSATNFACSSRPVIPGILISLIKQPMWFCSPDDKNSSADANDLAFMPTEPRRSSIAARMDSSSSTMATLTVFLFTDISWEGTSRRISAQSYFCMILRGVGLEYDSLRRNHPFPSPSRGNVKRNTAPYGSFGVAQICPPYDSTIERLIERPIPMPSALVV